MQVQGNAIIYLFLEDGICIRNKHTFVSSNDTKYSLTLFLAQQLTNQSKSENLETMTHRTVIAKKVHMYSYDTDVLLLALSWMQGKGKRDASQASLIKPRVLVALIELGEDAEPSVVVVTGCE